MEKVDAFRCTTASIIEESLQCVQTFGKQSQRLTHENPIKNSNNKNYDDRPESDRNRVDTCMLGPLSAAHSCGSNGCFDSAHWLVSTYRCNHVQWPTDTRQSSSVTSDNRPSSEQCPAGRIRSADLM